ncbi:hypothetical protein [Thioclava sp. GXIMD4215]|uniref:hypothetical protein n=1 Tax=Thioclava sp. GXIMD4215 TaxID=3131928 RepID=UPI0032443F1D
MTRKQHEEMINALYDAMCLTSLVSAATCQLDDTPTTAGIRTGCETIMAKISAVQDTLEVEWRPAPR